MATPTLRAPYGVSSPYTVDDPGVLKNPFGLGTGGGGGAGPTGPTGSTYVGTTTNTGNAYVATPSPALGAYTNGLYIAQFNASNTGATTLNISGLGAKNVYLNGAALTGGEIAANAMTAVTYDGTQFNMTGDGRGGSGGSSPLTTKGDIYGYGSANMRVPIGADNQIPIADSSQTAGWRWGLGPCFPLFPPVTPPLASSFSIIAGGTATVNLSDKSDRLQVQTSNVLAPFKGGMRSISGTPYTVDLLVYPAGGGASGGTFSIDYGIAISDGTAYRVFDAYLSGGQNNTRVLAFTTAGSDGTAPVTIGRTHTSILWLRLTNDGTTRTFLTSPNGKDFAPIYTEAAGLGLTETQVGFYTSCTSGGTLGSKFAIYYFNVANSVLGDAA